jgi:hypothetical protein
MLRDRFMGCWQLVSYSEQLGVEGPIRYPHGEDAVGLLIYTRDGYMSAQIMTRGRPEYGFPYTGGGTTEQAAAASSGYLGYSGSFSVDEATGDVRHQVVVSLLPNWLGQTQLRHSRFDGNCLTLTAVSELPDGQTFSATLVWERAGRVP